MDTRKLIKISIYAYDDKDYKTLSQIKINPFYLPLNPERITQKFGAKPSTTSNSFVKTLPKKLKLKFIFDGTNTLMGYKYNSQKQSVKAQLKLFEETVYTNQKNNCKPRFLKIMWGKTLWFQGILYSLTLKHTLFEPNGEPLRTKVKAIFINKEEQARVLQ